MGDIDVKTYEDEEFYGKNFPAFSNLEMIRGEKSDMKTSGVVQVYYFFNTFYKGGFICNEELTALFEKHKDVQFCAIGNDPEKEKIEKLLGKIEAGTCCDPITHQVFRLGVPFIAWDEGKKTTKAMQDILNASTLHTPQAFIVDGTGKLVWRQNLLQNKSLNTTNFDAQLTLVKEGKAVAQPNGKKPKPVADEGETAEGMEDDMSLF